MMSTEENKQLISGLIDEVWNQHDPAAIDHYFGPDLREEVAGHYRQLLNGFPDLQVTIEDDLIAEADMVVARLTLMGTHTGTFAGRPGSGHLAGWSSIRIYRVADGKVVQTWARPPRRSPSGCASDAGRAGVPRRGISRSRFTRSRARR